MCLSGCGCALIDFWSGSNGVGWFCGDRCLTNWMLCCKWCIRTLSCAAPCGVLDWFLIPNILYRRCIGIAFAAACVIASSSSSFPSACSFRRYAYWVRPSLKMNFDNMYKQTTGPGIDFSPNFCNYTQINRTISPARQRIENFWWVDRAPVSQLIGNIHARIQRIDGQTI